LIRSLFTSLLKDITAKSELKGVFGGISACSGIIRGYGGNFLREVRVLKCSFG